MRLAVIGLPLLLGCTEPGNFKPAQGVKDHEWKEDRAALADNEGAVASCEYMGTADASGDDVQYAISHTAAMHGATHYLLKHSEDTVEGYQTQTQVYGGSNWAVANSRTTAIHKTFAWAKVYHCGAR